MGDQSPLDAPLPTANPEGLVQALAACERDNALLGDGVAPVLAPWEWRGKSAGSAGN